MEKKESELPVRHLLVTIASLCRLSLPTCKCKLVTTQPRNQADIEYYFSYVSPRKRAQRTLELLNLGCRDRLPWQQQQETAPFDIRTDAKVQIDEDVREWDYGNYEGLTSATIKEQRAATGEGLWDIWRDGAPGGEYVWQRGNTKRSKIDTNWQIARGCHGKAG